MHRSGQGGHVGSAVALLYYVNTLGAGAACLACAAILFPFAGMQGAIYVAAGVNVAVAAGALAAYWRERGEPIATAEDLPLPAAARQPILGFAPVLALAGAGGFVSLSYEIFFFRTVAFLSGSSATSSR